MSQYPLVPGHEIVGKVTRIGAMSAASRTETWSASAGWWTAAARLSGCSVGLEQYCHQGPTLTYSVPDRQTGEITKGGFSHSIVVDEDFVLSVPEGLDPAKSRFVIDMASLEENQQSSSRA